jgi:hypothetical protein
VPEAFFSEIHRASGRFFLNAPHQRRIILKFTVPEAFFSEIHRASHCFSKIHRASARFFRSPSGQRQVF